MTRGIASSVALITAAAESMKDADGWVNPEDPTVIAENELMGAAATIDHAARRLLELRPRREVTYKVRQQRNNHAHSTLSLSLPNDFFASRWKAVI